MTSRTLLPAAWHALALMLATPAWAHGDGAEHARSAVVREQTDWGIGGDARQAHRTVTVRMSDTMRFTPDLIEVRVGETLRLRVRNEGRLMHELVLGTPAVLQAHAAQMLRFPNMEHDEPYMVHVAPGRTGEILWTFNRPGEFEFACLIPGHFQAGMKGRIRVRPH